MGGVHYATPGVLAGCLCHAVVPSVNRPSIQPSMRASRSLTVDMSACKASMRLLKRSNMRHCKPTTATPTPMIAQNSALMPPFPYAPKSGSGLIDTIQGYCMVITVACRNPATPEPIRGRLPIASEFRRGISIWPIICFGSRLVSLAGRPAHPIRAWAARHLATLRGASEKRHETQAINRPHGIMPPRGNFVDGAKKALRGVDMFGKPV